MKTFDELREAYRKPTQAEIDADRRKDGKGKDTSSRYKNIKKKMYGNAMGGLKKEESVQEGRKTQRLVFDTTSKASKAEKSAKRLNLRTETESQGGNYYVAATGDHKDISRWVKMSESTSKVDEAKLSDMGIHNKIADRNLLIKAIKTAEKMGGNMTGAVREIEKMKKGLSKHKAVQAALRQANESVDQTDEILEESDTFHVKVGDGRDHMIVKTKAKNSREAVKKIKSQYPKDRVSLYRESVELSEAPDLMKMSKELLKHKDKGIDYEKAAAYVRAIHNNSAVSVQDKAMKGLLDLLKNMDLTDRTTITKILKDNGFKTKGGRLMREEVESLDENYRTLATHGMGAETKNTINVGRDVDYYEPKNGDKRQGRITKVTRSGYVVKDENDGKSHTFAFHDRAKAKEIMAKNK